MNQFKSAKKNPFMTNKPCLSVAKKLQLILLIAELEYGHDTIQFGLYKLGIKLKISNGSVTMSIYADVILLLVSINL
jgi:hypothetical protein